MPGSKSYPSLPPNVDPIKAKVPPGGYVVRAEGVSFHAKLKVTRLQVRNTGDRPVQVGSHFHFFEANRALEFDRAAAFGLHLNIPAATALRFEPGDEREVQLVPFQGKRGLYGFNNLVDGPTSGEAAEAGKKKAVAAAARRGFRSTAAQSSDQSSARSHTAGTAKRATKKATKRPAARSRSRKSGKR